jgi:hypothetical protein
MEPDLHDIDERLWNLYVIDCERTQTKPSIKDFIIWREERED